MIGKFIAMCVLFCLLITIGSLLYVMAWIPVGFLAWIF